jgi:hypothetical protein
MTEHLGNAEATADMHYDEVQALRRELERLRNDNALLRYRIELYKKSRKSGYLRINEVNQP